MDERMVYEALIHDDSFSSGVCGVRAYVGDGRWFFATFTGPEAVERAKEYVAFKNAQLPNRCEHGIADGDWCEPCNQAMKEARECPENR